LKHKNIQDLWTKFTPNKGQQSAILTTEGPLLITAGPGSGKSFTLVERVVNLIISGKAAPEEILVSTFTEKAAKELVTRISNRLLELDIRANINEMYVGTMHSIFLRILEEYREYTSLKRNYRMIDQFEQSYFIYQNLELFSDIEDIEELIGDRTRSSWFQSEALVKYIAKVSEEVLDIEVLKASGNTEVRVIGHVYEKYLEILAENNLIDFSSIQSLTLELLENNASVLSELHSKIKYLMIDEYQDTNTIQERIILLLGSAQNNICVVGDDDQGLYRFRGATIRNILEFPSHFNNCKQVFLNINYRSHPDIIDFYNDYMQSLDWAEDKKSFRFEKEIIPRDGNFSPSSAVIKINPYHNAESSQNYSLNEEILNFIHHVLDSGCVSNLNQVAFLFSSVKSDKVTQLADFLELNGIPVFSPRSAMFFDRPEIKTVLGCLISVIPNFWDLVKYSNGYEPRVWEYYHECEEYFVELMKTAGPKGAPLFSWCQKIVTELSTLNGKTTYAFTALLYELLQFEVFQDLLDVKLTENVTDQRAAYNLAQLSRLLAQYEFLQNVTVFTSKGFKWEVSKLFNGFFRFLKNGGIAEYEDFDQYAPDGCVSFMTIHQSKGMEFPITLVGSLKSVPRKSYKDIDVILQNEYYHKKPFEPFDRIKYFDFWRKYYVAFSRAQNVLGLLASEDLKKDGAYKDPSSYFHSVYEDIPSWRSGSFDIGRVKLETVKPVNIKKEYSFTSHILLYENCPTQYKFYKELEFAEQRKGAVLGGVLLHTTIEDIHKAAIKGETDRIHREQISDWFNENYEILRKQHRAYLAVNQRNALLEQIIKYSKRNENKWDQVKATEVDVSLVKDDFILKGTIDLVKGENGTVELLDFKSGSKLDVNSTDPKDIALLNRYRRQLEVYAHLVEERTGEKVSQMHLYFPKEEDSVPQITFPFNKESIDTTIESFAETVSKIESKNYDNDHIVKNKKQCGNCDMRFYCHQSHH